MNRLLGELALPASPTRFASRAALGAVGRLMRAACEEGDQFSAMVIESLCLELLGELDGGSDPRRAAPQWLLRAAEYLRDEHALEGVQAVARAVGVHPVHLTRNFRQHFRCTPGEFLRAHRIKRAANLLLDPRVSVAEVAADCAFADQSHLVRGFRRHFGTSPQKFRRAILGVSGNV